VEARSSRIDGDGRPAREVLDVQIVGTVLDRGRDGLDLLLIEGAFPSGVAGVNMDDRCTCVDTGGRRSGDLLSCSR